MTLKDEDRVSVSDSHSGQQITTLSVRHTLILYGKYMTGAARSTFKRGNTIHVRTNEGESHALRVTSPGEQKALETADVVRALAVIMRDPKIRSWLCLNDPKAFEQAEKALAPFGYPDNLPSK